MPSTLSRQALIHGASGSSLSPLGSGQGVRVEGMQEPGVAVWPDEVWDRAPGRG